MKLDSKRCTRKMMGLITVVMFIGALIAVIGSLHADSKVLKGDISSEQDPVIDESTPYFSETVSMDSIGAIDQDVKFIIDVDERSNVKTINPISAKQITLDPQIEKELKERKKPMQGLFETVLETKVQEGKVDIRFFTKNISGKDLQIYHGSGQRYDIWVYNDQNEEVYRWSNNMAFTQALIEIELGKDEQLAFQEEWHLKDNEGNPVPTGTYTILSKVMVGLKSGGTINQDELMASSQVEL